MAECKSNETDNIYPNLNKRKFRLNKIKEIKDYFVAEIKGIELMTKRLIKYTASFDYFDKSLIILSVTAGSTSIASFATVIGAPVGMVSVIFSLACSIFTDIVKKLLKTTRNKKKKLNKIIMLSRSKLNSTESKIFDTSTNNEISHEDSMTIINEEKKISRIKRKD